MTKRTRTPVRAPRTVPRTGRRGRGAAHEWTPHTVRTAAAHNGPGLVASRAVTAAAEAVAEGAAAAGP